MKLDITDFQKFAKAMNTLPVEQREAVGNALSNRRAHFRTRLPDNDTEAMGFANVTVSKREDL